MAGTGAGQWRKGDVVATMPDGHQWGSMEGLPDFICVDVSDGEMTDVAVLNGVWARDLDWDVVQSFLAQDRHRLLIWTTNRRARDGLGDPVVADLQAFLEEWGAISILAGTRNGASGVRCDMVVFSAATSPRFWEREVGVGEFTELAYVQAGGVHDIRLIYPAQFQHARALVEVGAKATILQESAAERRVDFRITRADMLAAFKVQLRELGADLMKRRRRYISAAAVDQAIGLGGTVTSTKAQVQASIQDAMDD